MFNTQTDAISGDLHDLLTYLEAGFRQETNQPAGIKLNEAGFLDWASRHLTENRPSEVFAVDNNYGILLTNGQRIQLCPNVAGEPQRTGGDMANPDASISITRTRK